jgi:hypothetical protein
MGKNALIPSPSTSPPPSPLPRGEPEGWVFYFPATALWIYIVFQINILARNKVLKNSEVWLQSSAFWKTIFYRIGK